MEIWATKDIRRRTVEVSMLRITREGDIVAQPVVFSPIDQGAIITPALAFTLEEASTLMTELWNAGVRPAAVGTTGELAALKYHLEDMRSLVFKKSTK